MYGQGVSCFSFVRVCFTGILLVYLINYKFLCGIYLLSALLVFMFSIMVSPRWAISLVSWRCWCIVVVE